MKKLRKKVLGTAIISYIAVFIFFTSFSESALEKHSPKSIARTPTHDTLYEIGVSLYFIPAENEPEIDALWGVVPEKDRGLSVHTHKMKSQKDWNGEGREREEDKEHEDMEKNDGNGGTRGDRLRDDTFTKQFSLGPDERYSENQRTGTLKISMIDPARGPYQSYGAVEKEGDTLFEFQRLKKEYNFST